DQRIGLDEIKQHSWFSDIDWEMIGTQQAPFVPNLTSKFDTQYFEPVDPLVEKKWFNPSERKNNTNLDLDDSVLELRKKLAFVGFTYRGFRK
ncbi:hypothetical protein HK096_000974, partial [Nowakowskiella sp. JEL0078]